MSLVLNPTLYAGTNPDDWDSKTLTTTPESPGWYVRDLGGFVSADTGSGQLTINASGDIFWNYDFFTNGPAVAIRDQTVAYNNIDVSVDVVSATLYTRSLILYGNTGDYAAFHQHATGQWGYIFSGTINNSGWTGTRFRMTYDGTNVRWYVDGVLKFTQVVSLISARFGLAAANYAGVGTTVYENFLEVPLV